MTNPTRSPAQTHPEVAQEQATSVAPSASPGEQIPEAMRMLSFRRAASVYVAFLDTLAGALSEHGPRAEANDAAAATVLGMLDAMAHASCVMSAHIARKSALGSTLHRTRAGRLPSPQRRI